MKKYLGSIIANSIYLYVILLLQEGLSSLNSIKQKADFVEFGINSRVIYPDFGSMYKALIGALMIIAFIDIFIWLFKKRQKDYLLIFSNSIKNTTNVFLAIILITTFLIQIG